MIFTSVSINVKDGKSTQDRDVYIYRGDKNIEIRFTIISPFKYTDVGDFIEDSNAFHAQLVLKKPNSKNEFIFSSIEPTKYGMVNFLITEEMIDELTEVGDYDYQIRLYDESLNSRISIPPIIGGIKLLEPISLGGEEVEDVLEVALVGKGKVGQCIVQ